MQSLPFTQYKINIKHFKKTKNHCEYSDYGIVYEIQDIKTNELFAAKVIASNYSEEFINREIEILIRANHPTIIKFIGFSLKDFNEEEYVMIIMELAEKGSLLNILRRIRSGITITDFNNTIRQIILIGVSRGMKYLHDHRIIHKNLKSENVLLDKDFKPLITDFAMSKCAESKDQFIACRNLSYMAPEIIKCSDYDTKTDVYSFGILMYEIVTEMIPYPDLENGQISEFDFQNKIINEDYRPKFEKAIKESFKELIEQCWSKDPNERPSFSKIYEMLSNKDNQFDSKYFLDDVEFNKIKHYVETIQKDDDNNDISIEKKQLMKSIKDKTMEIVNEDNETIPFKSENNINYKLSLKNLTAEVVESQEATGDVLIPEFIEYQSKRFDVIEICDEAFKDSKVDSVSFVKESKVQKIGNLAFVNSTIHKLFIPKSLMILSKQWVQGAKELNEIEIDENNSFFSNKSGFLIYSQQTENQDERPNGKNKSKEILFSPQNFEGDYIIPEDVSSIGRFAFCHRTGLISVKSELPSPIKIKSFCFYKCDNLLNVILKGQSDILLGGCSFAHSKNLLSVDVSSKTIVIGKNCFENCSSLNSINFTTDGKVALGSNSFKGCSSLENILIYKASLIKIGDECFTDATNLKSATFVGNSVILGNNIINNCSLLSLITIESIDNISITSTTFGNCNLKYIKISTSSTLKLNDTCFNSKNLENIELSFKSINFGKNCFSECPSLSKITFQSENELRVFNDFFTGCESLKNIFIASKSSILIFDHFMNESLNLETVEISGKHIIIGPNCFNNCQSLSHFTVTNSGKIEFKENQFINCSKLVKISIQCSTINIMQNQICNYKSLKYINIESYSEIFFRSNCFKGFVNLEKVSISGENILIEDNCFKKCSNLNRIICHKANNLILKSNVFKKCEKLNEINFKTNSNIVCGNECFSGSYIEKILFESKSVYLEKSCFKNHLTSKSRIISVHINSEKVKIDELCFNDCSLLKIFSISSAKEVELGKNAFEKCDSLEEISFKVEDKIKISDSCFSKSQNLKSLSILSAKDIIIGKTAFENCESLENVFLKTENKIIICDNCFLGANKLKTFEFSCKEALFEDYCFCGCLSLKNFITHNTDKIIFSREVFDCCDNLENLAITARSEFQAGDYCFDRLQNLKNVTIDSPKVTIGDFCFNSCVSLRSISFPNVEEITYYDSYLLDCFDVNIAIKPGAIKKEIKSEKLEIYKPFINHNDDS